ncbi:MAG: GTPase, partial [Bacillota bacterium]|nr:GTPase [Bacillota bacterium]
QSFLIDLIEDMLKNVAPIDISAEKQKKVAFIGPTGVGKTTTIAKLAAHFTILEKKQVGLITADTYRIAAVEQLKTYAEIIGVPLEVVFTPEEMKRGLAKFAEKDIVLIDTAGRSHKNQLHMSELRSFLNYDTTIDIEKVLVLSAASKNIDLYEIVDKYSSDIIIDKIIFTKLDETSTFGPLLNISYKSKKALSYLTTGQNVPDDIELANPQRIANIIVKGSVI